MPLAFTNDPTVFRSFFLVRVVQTNVAGRTNRCDEFGILRHVTGSIDISGVGETFDNVNAGGFAITFVGCTTTMPKWKGGRDRMHDAEGKERLVEGKKK